MAKRKRKRRSLAAIVVEAVLSLVDMLCEGAAFLLVSLMKSVGKTVLLAVRGAWALVCLAVRALGIPFAWLWRKMTGGHRRAEQCLRLTGEEFEHYVALLLHDHYYRNIEMTKGSGDQGVDILCERNGKTYAIQCKNYAGSVGNFAVQEAYAGAQFYGCDVPVVICPGSFTRGAKELAESTGVTLWDGEKLSRMMRKSGRRPGRRKTYNHSKST